jgi:carbonic anhydrase
MITYEQIFENNQRWVAEHSTNTPDFFTQLAANQEPDYLYIGCSDSRVTAEDLMGVAPGEVFVHRNIANLVPNNDLSSLSVLEYAVRHLHVKQIVVCGHYGCGGVKAAMQSKDLGIRDVYRLHHVELDAIADIDARYDRLVELNVQEQCVNVLKSAVVQEQYLLRKLPAVHGWVFDLRTGLLKDLNLDFEHILRDIQQIYNLSDEVAPKAESLPAEVVNPVPAT